MLTTYDINTKLKNHSGFKGTYPITDLPNFLLQKPAGLVINLDPRWEEGSHWVAVYIPSRGPAVYFDSYGRYPPEPIIALMERNSRYGWKHSTLKLQGDLSTLCGWYCIGFLKSCPDYFSFLRRFQHCDTHNDEELMSSST